MYKKYLKKKKNLYTFKIILHKKVLKVIFNNKLYFFV